jgi:hypothetical protein
MLPPARNVEPPQQCLAEQQPAKLPRARAHQPQQGQLTAALDGRERERRADDETGDERRQAQRHAEQRDRGRVAVPHGLGLRRRQSGRDLGGRRRDQGEQRRLD